MLVSVSSNINFRMVKCVLNVDEITSKGKDMLPIGSIFFPFKVAPMRIDNKFKGHYIEKQPKLIYAKMSVL